MDDNKKIYQKIGMFTPLIIFDKYTKDKDYDSLFFVATMMPIMIIWLFGFIWLWLPFQIYNDIEDLIMR